MGDYVMAIMGGAKTAFVRANAVWVGANAVYVCANAVWDSAKSTCDSATTADDCVLAILKACVCQKIRAIRTVISYGT